MTQHSFQANALNHDLINRIDRAQHGEIVVVDGVAFQKVAPNQLQRLYPVVGLVVERGFQPYDLPQLRPAVANEVIDVDGRTYRIVEEGNGRRRWWAYPLPEVQS